MGYPLIPGKVPGLAVAGVAATTECPARAEVVHGASGEISSGRLARCLRLQLLM